MVERKWEMEIIAGKYRKGSFSFPSRYIPLSIII